ncbi:UNVERIFIED_CONTAM: hypothetical protein Sradi_3863700 [Sesamum radiatum]|uniref:Uncharacterized protein n=1 Tax=Sesamum radiatum TaxID=300843 RepID=A0AAW2Q213_SESRA
MIGPTTMGAVAIGSRVGGATASTPSASGRGAPRPRTAMAEDSVFVPDEEEELEEPVATCRTQDRALDNVGTKSLAKR